MSLVAGETPETPEYILVSFQPLLDETSLGAASHVALFDAILVSYNLRLDNCVCLVGDNCSTNKCIADTWKVPLIGCSSHPRKSFASDIGSVFMDAPT